MRRATTTGAALTLLVGVLLAGARGVHASHYDLVDVDLVTVQERQALARAGIEATDALLRATATRRGRRALARRTGLTPARVLELARMADLLRIEGIGPRMVRLLTAAGVPDTARLVAQDPEALHRKLVDTNDRLHLAGLVPPADMLAAWMKRARELGQVLQQ